MNLRMRPSQYRARLATVGVTAVVAVGVVGLAASPASAYANSHFLQKLAASQPSGFPVSPAALDLSRGPITSMVSIPVRNLTARAVTVSLNMSTQHILTMGGVDISSGGPDETFPSPGTWYRTTTQAAPVFQSSSTFTVPASGNLTITMPVTLSQCGYYQFDALNVPNSRLLAAGVIRALQCTAAPRLTPGYWKNHQTQTAALLPVNLGNYAVSDFASAQAVFAAMKCSNPTDCLAGHLLAAELDVKSGAATCIQPTVDEANQFLLEIGYQGPGSVTGLAPAQDQQAIEYKTDLDDYTNDSTSLSC